MTRLDGLGSGGAAEGGGMRTAGRPKGLQFSVFIGVKVTPADAERLARLVAQAGTHQSALLRALIREATLEEDLQTAEATTMQP